MQVTSQRGRDVLAVVFEGIVTRAYRDTKGIWTIGVGHTAAAGAPVPKAGLTMTRAEVLDLFGRDLAKYEAAVRKAFGKDVPQNVFDGAVSFHFNTGAIETASWVPLWLAKRLDEARAHFVAWNKPKEIVGRRTQEAMIVFENIYPRVDETAPAQATTGAPGYDVLELQVDLAKLGFNPGAADGKFGDQTRAAVKAYQAQHPDLVADGIPGPATRSQIARDIAALEDVSHGPMPSVTAEPPMLVPAPVPPAPARPSPTKAQPELVGLFVLLVSLAGSAAVHFWTAIVHLFHLSGG